MMSLKPVLLLFLCIYCFVSYAHPSTKVFRYDYQFVESENSFYKLHRSRRTWQEAKNACADEGASLLYPDDAAEAAVITDITRQALPTYYEWIFVGGSARISKEVFQNINGVPVDTLYNNWGPDEPKVIQPDHCVVFNTQDRTLGRDSCTARNSFICKKSAADWDNNCNMPNLGYKYDETSQRCYRFHANPSNLNWVEAKSTCEAEMSYLAVINNQAEAGLLSNITHSSGVLRTKRDNNECVFLGYSKSELGWQTIHGTPLSKIYNQWGTGEPNNAGPNEYCGGMYYNGQLNDLGCHLGCFFICEHEVDLILKQSTPTVDDSEEFVVVSSE